MAENNRQSNDPILNFLKMLYRFTYRTIWAIIKLAAIIVKDIIVNTPAVYRQAKKLARWIRDRFSNKPGGIERKEKAALVREMDAAGKVVRVALYITPIEATNNLAKDFLRNHDFARGVPDHTLEMFDISYPKTELDLIREEIADGELRYFDNFHTLDGVEKLSEGSLISEYFKDEQGISPFSELDNEGLFLYDLFMNRQQEYKEKAVWEGLAEKGDYSLEGMLNSISGRSKLTINDFAQVLNNHSSQLDAFLNNENAVVLLDAISHHPEITSMGGMSVDHIASLDPKHIQPINLLVLRLIGKTNKNPALSAKAQRTIRRIQTERDWLDRDKEIFETRYDDKSGSILIQKYAEANCNSVLRAMMATTFIKTLDDRNMSQRSLFEQQVAAFSRTAPVLMAMKQFDEGKLTPVNYTLPFYFGAVQRLADTRHELTTLIEQMSKNGSLVGGDLFGENKQYLEITQKIREYSEAVNLCHHSLEVQTLDIQKMTNIRIAISSGKVTDPDGNIRPDIRDAAGYIASKYMANPAVITRIKEILQDTPLQELCHTLYEPAIQPEVVLPQIQSDHEEMGEHQTQTPLLDSEQEITGEENVQIEQQDYETTGKDLSSAIRTYGIDTIISSPEIIKSFAIKFAENFPDIGSLNHTDYNLAITEALRTPVTTTADSEHLRNLAVCIAGISYGYINADNTAEDLLISSGYSPDEISALPLQTQEEEAAKIAEFWLNRADNRIQQQPSSEIDWGTVALQTAHSSTEELTPKVGFKI